MKSDDTYGVLSNGAHVDVSKSEKGAKQYATRNGHSIVTVRYNNGYITKEIAYRWKGKWYPIVDGQIPCGITG